MYFLLFVLIIFALIVPFFLSRRLSPIPYFPTNNADVPMIVKILLGLGNGTIMDLGAGTGEVLMETARVGKGNRYILVENNPWLVLILHMKRLFHPNKSTIEILCSNMFKDKLPQASIVYIYVGPYVIEQVKVLLEKMKIGTYVVSYFYEIPEWEKRLVKKTSGKHEIYVYRR